MKLTLTISFAQDAVGAVGDVIARRARDDGVAGAPFWPPAPGPGTSTKDATNANKTATARARRRRQLYRNLIHDSYT